MPEEFLETKREVFTTIEGPAATTLAWLARNKSSLLLKTASLRARLRKADDALTYAV